MTKSTLLNMMLTTLLILSIGLLIGFSVGYRQAQQAAFPDLKPIEELNPGVPTLKLMKVEGGTLVGEVAGQEVRVAYSPDHILDIKPGETFEIPLNAVNLDFYYQAKNLPDGVNFIASKSGKYYYHLLDPRALRLSPQSRIYFKSEDEALAEGYMAPK